MNEVPANPNIAPKRYSPFWFRVLEIFPGATVWLALIAPFFLARYYPLQVTLFIIVFDVYWLQKAVYSAGSLYIGYRKMQATMRTDWLAKMDELSALSPEERKKQDILDPKEIYQAVILTTYREEYEILEASLESLDAAKFDHQKIYFILATEERDRENARANAKKIQEKYGKKFFRFLVTVHPDNIVGEVKAKGANAAWAAKELRTQVEKDGVAFDRIMVSAADADSRFHPSYFARLTYVYCTTKDRNHCSYQPISTFLNNVWEAPMISRVIAFSTTFWHLTESVLDYRMFTFSTHATSLKTLIEIDYWCTSVVNEDSRQFFRAFFHYKGKFSVVPLFMPVYMDAVHVNNAYRTWKNLYLQQQRWAYGVEHFPYIVLESLRQRQIPILDRFLLVWRAFHGAFSWATNAFFISVVGWLPIILNNEYRDQVVASNFPLVTSWILTLTWVGVFASTTISLRLLPPRPANRKVVHLIPMVIQWILIPISTIFFGAIPGIDAQTRLMFGKYLGFRVTEKKAVRPAPPVPNPALGK